MFVNFQYNNRVLDTATNDAEGQPIRVLNKNGNIN
jgi:hypothetical protein